jgi:hypothetical protein
MPLADAGAAQGGDDAFLYVETTRPYRQRR